MERLFIDLIIIASAILCVVGFLLMVDPGNARNGHKPVPAFTGEG